MSDDILSVETPYPDVASLAQGYINRVDGERLLMPLEEQCDEGAGVRFVIYLADGTAAFAGSGRCAQISDQGAGVPPPQRFETLIDSLDLDDRSRPVYDYIVAVRNAAYSQGAAAAEEPAVDEEAAASAPAEEAAQLKAVEPSVDVAGKDTSDDEASVEEPSEREPSEREPSEREPSEREPSDRESDGEAGDALEADFGASIPVEADEPAHAGAGPQDDYGSLEEEPEALSEEAAHAVTVYASQRPDPQSSPPGYSPLPPSPDSYPVSMSGIPGSFRPEATSFIPPALPTGILQRPARALHWQPSPPRRPTPLPQTGLFRYSGPGLPAPSAAPRPNIDPSLLVRRAPRP